MKKYFRIKAKPLIGGSIFLALYLVIPPSVLPNLAAQESAQQEKKMEPLSKWSRQWLKEIVPYIITSKEKKSFQKLSTEEERGKFILNFWKLRDPDRSTPVNEFKLEHYRRIAIANKFFGASGIAGWRTVRGKVFILLGPPNYITLDTKPNPARENEQAKMITLQSLFQPDQSLWWGQHGGKQVWTYYGIPGARGLSHIEFVFLDKHGSGNYELERTVRHGDGVGADGKALERGGIEAMHSTFDRLENQAEALTNPFERADKAKGTVTTKVAYEYIPLGFEAFNLKGPEEKTYSTLAVDIPYSSLSSRLSDGKYHFSLGVIVIIRDKEDQLVYEGSKEKNYYRSDSEFKELKDKVYNLQIPMVLEPDSYKIEVLVLDNYSGKVGTLEKEISLPSFEGKELSLSNIFLSLVKEEKLAVDEAAPDLNVSAMKNVFRAGEEMNVYFEAYNLSLNPETGLSDLKIEYMFFSGDKLLAKVPGPLQELKDQKDYKVSTSFKLRKFKPGEYILRVKVIDSNLGVSVSKEILFFVTQ
ncbi:MAG: GWxTD domain-containing protein [Candidatus Aminicenantes bacterium]|nr:MAG: GWxTD domain-containing protein [Candidatus Aminicenantes bacterium]